MSKIYMDSDMVVDVSLYALDVYRVYLDKVKNSIPIVVWEKVSTMIDGFLERRTKGYELCVEKDIFDYTNIGRLTFEHVFGNKSLDEHIHFIGDWRLPAEVIFPFIIEDGINMKKIKLSLLFDLFTLKQVDKSVDATVIITNNAHVEVMNKTYKKNIKMIYTDSNNGPIQELKQFILYTNREDLIDTIRDKGNAVVFSSKEIEGTNLVEIHNIN